MSIEQRLAEDMKEALRAKQARRLNCIRMLRAKLMEQQVALREKHGRNHVLTDDEAQQVVAAYAKQRRDSIEAFEQAGRDDLAAGEREELAIVAAYLPDQLDDAALRQLVREAIAESGAGSASGLGAVMKVLMPKVKGRADGKRVNAIVRELLGG
jgi:uncharacterized protein YqeY